MRADLVRSLVRVKSSDSEHQIGLNIRAVRDSHLTFTIPEDGEIWVWVNDFALTYEHPPEAQTVKEGLLKQNKTSAIDRLDSILNEPLRVGGDFIKVLEEVVETRRVQLLHQICRDAVVAAQSGLEIKQGKVKRTIRGAVEAASHLQDQLRDVAAPTLSNSLSGEILSDVESIEADYDRAKADPLSALGQLSGIMQMDERLRGARRAELWVHAAFAGHLKTTLALNWAYTQAFLYRESVLYFSLEVPYKQIRRWVVAMHSLHPKFTDIRMELGLQTHEQDDRGIEYTRLRDGNLTEIEEIFLKQYLLPDLKDPSNEYGRVLVESADPDRPDISVEGLKNRAEMIYPKTPFGLVVVDHASLLGDRNASRSPTDRLNDALRDLKRFALQFRRGQTCPVLALFQINREGLTSALKRKEKGQLPTYDLNHLSYANECERSADVITASYLDKEYGEKNRALITNLKSRDNAPFDPFFVRIEWGCRRMMTCLDNPNDSVSSRVAPDQKEAISKAIDQII